jgi:hypothetical protein
MDQEEHSPAVESKLTTLQTPLTSIRRPGNRTKQQLSLSFQELIILEL